MKLDSRDKRLAVFTLEDEQTVWTDKSSQTDESSEFVRLFVRPSRRTSRVKSDLDSHSDGIGGTNGRFARLGGMELAKGAMVCGKHAWSWPFTQSSCGRTNRLRLTNRLM